jgi:phage terminase large subunit GpA-like protein
MLNKAFYEMDINGQNTLYVLPTKTPDAGDFSAARFDPAIELSPYLQKMFSDVKNVGHKRAGSVNLYIRGSRSKAGLKSVPAGLLILDEVEEMNQENIPLAMERMSGQIEKLCWAISTPFVEGEGINKLYKTSTQEHFFFTCPSCGKLTELLFPESFLYVDGDLTKSQYICKECKNILPHDLKTQWLSTGRWVPMTTNTDVRGFYINQMYSPAISPFEWAKAYRNSLNNAADEQEFYNSKLGLPHEPEGARVTTEALEACICDKCKDELANQSGIITMGIDVGKQLHYEVDLWKFPATPQTSDINIDAKCILIDEGHVEHFEQLDSLMHKFQVNFAVIDANPERRKAFEFAMRFFGHVKLCFYGVGINGKQISVGKIEEATITVDRTSWMDMSLSRFRNKSMTLPRNVSLSYRQHIQAPVRILVKDSNGNIVARYNEGSKEDHLAHARTYSEIALPFAASFGANEDIKDY